jgi:hypothetical protein
MMSSTVVIIIIIINANVCMKRKYNFLRCIVRTKCSEAAFQSTALKGCLLMCPKSIVTICAIPILGVAPVRSRRGGEGVPSTQRYYPRSFFYYSFNCYMFRSYDHLQADIYFLEQT